MPTAPWPSSPRPDSRRCRHRRGSQRLARSGYRLSAADRVPVVVLISGRGSNMRALIERSADRRSGIEVAARALRSAGGARDSAIARDLGVPARALPAPRRGASPRRGPPTMRGLAAAIEGYRTRARGARRLHAHLVAALRGPLSRAALQHPPLAPAQVSRASTPIGGSSRRGDEEHGATVHFVTGELDGGTARDPGQARGGTRRRRRAPGLPRACARAPHLSHWRSAGICTGRLRYAQGHGLARRQDALRIRYCTMPRWRCSGGR